MRQPGRRKEIRALLAGACVAAVAMALGPIPAAAQAKWPSKPITYIVPFAAGGTTDVLARLIGQKLGAALGTTVVVDNRPGAGGNVGSEIAARAAPDGHTILGGTISSHAINVSLYPKMGYDPVKSFEPVILIGSNGTVLIVGSQSPFKSVQDIINAAKAKPGTLTYASAGNGTSQHLSAEMFKLIAKIDMAHVPYKGSGPAIQDVIGNQVPMMFDTTVVAAPHIASGRVRPLAVSTAKRVPSLPEVPTMQEAGVAGFDVVSWQAIFAPAGTPVAIVERLHDEVDKILKMPDVQERFATLGIEPGHLSRQEFAAFQKSEISKWATVVKEAGIKID
jgi:tripartite-type tricarboxylate transporter receptor subunit TctC